MSLICWRAVQVSTLSHHFVGLTNMAYDFGTLNNIGSKIVVVVLAGEKREPIYIFPSFMSMSNANNIRLYIHIHINTYIYI